MICLFPITVFAGSSDSDIIYTSKFDDRYTYGNILKCKSPTGVSYDRTTINGVDVCLTPRQWSDEETFISYNDPKEENFICEDSEMERVVLQDLEASNGSYPDYGQVCGKLKDIKSASYTFREIKIGSTAEVADQNSYSCNILEGDATIVDCKLTAQTSNSIRVRAVHKLTKKAEYYRYIFPNYNNESVATEITCEYVNDLSYSASTTYFTVQIKNSKLEYEFKVGGNVIGDEFINNKLTVDDFISSDGSYKCLPKIFHLKNQLYGTYTFQKECTDYAMYLKGTTPTEEKCETETNSGGNNTENPSNDDGNNEVNVNFWVNLDVIVCGSTTVPAPVPPLVRLVVMALKIVTPFVLIIMGMVDMLKAVIGSKDDEIKKEQQKFVKRVIAAVLVFFVVSILQFVVSFVAPEETDSVLRCVDCLINDASKCN